MDKLKANPNSIIHLTNKYSRHTNETNNHNSNDANIIDTKSLTNISRDKNLHQHSDKQLIIRDEIIVDISYTLKGPWFKMTNAFGKNLEKKIVERIHRSKQTGMLIKRIFELQFKNS